MFSQRTIQLKVIAASVMMAALLLLTSANYWAYGFKKVAISNIQATEEEEPGSLPSVPNSAEEKASCSLQNIAEYLHNHSLVIQHPVVAVKNNFTHSFDRLPVHHPELHTPPPKINS